MPVIEFDSTKHDFGTVGLGSAKLKRRFVFRNAGAAPLRIRDIKDACSCTASTITKTVLQPGEEGEIELVMELGTVAVQSKVGLVQRSVYVDSNDPENRLVKLTVECVRKKNHFHYPSYVTLGPVFLQQPATGQLYYFPKKDIMAKYEPKVRATAKFLTAKIERRMFEKPPFGRDLSKITREFDFATSESAYPREGHVITVDLLTTAPAGQFYQYLALETGDPIDSRIMIRVFAEVREPMEISPRRVFLGMVTNSQELKRTITITARESTSLRITSVESEIGFVRPELRQISPHEWKVDLKLDRGHFAVGDFKGLLKLTSNHPTMEKFTIGIYGRAKASSAD